MYPDHPGHQPLQRAVEVHRPTGFTPPAALHPAPLVPVQPDAVLAVASIILEDGRIVTGYAIPPARPEPVTAKPTLSRTAVNVALGGIGFGAVCGGLWLLTAFITALTALITQLIVLAAVVFGGWITAQLFGTNSGGAGTTVTIRKAIFKRNHFHG